MIVRNLLHGGALLAIGAGLAGGVALALAPADAEVIREEPDFFVTRDEVVVAADPQAVWLALISPAGWWNDASTWSGDASNLTLTPQGGGCFCERIPATDDGAAVGLVGSAQHMTVVQAFPRKVLRMRGALGPLQSEPVEGVLTITIKPVENGTRILWEYVVGGKSRYQTAEIAKAVDGVMNQQLTGLAKKLGGAVDGAAQAPDTVAETPASPKSPATAKPPQAEAEPNINSGNVLDAVDEMGKKPKG